MKLPRKTLLLIGLLAIGGGVVLSLWSKLQTDLQAMKSMKHAYQIYQLLSAYESTHNDAFPTGEQWSNEAFRELFRSGLADDEQLFFLKGSPWCQGEAADGKIGSADDGTPQAVGAGENHFGYVSGLQIDKVSTTKPLVLGGFVPEGSSGTDLGKKHSVGRILVRVGGSVQAEYDEQELRKTLATEKYLPPQPIGK